MAVLQVKSRKISISDACIWAADAWNHVKQSTIANCFQKAGFDVSNENQNTTTDDLESLAVSVKFTGFTFKTSFNLTTI